MRLSINENKKIKNVSSYVGSLTRLNKFKRMDKKVVLTLIL